VAFTKAQLAKYSAAISKLGWDKKYGWSADALNPGGQRQLALDGIIDGEIPKEVVAIAPNGDVLGFAVTYDEKGRVKPAPDMILRDAKGNVLGVAPDASTGKAWNASLNQISQIANPTLGEIFGPSRDLEAQGEGSVLTSVSGWTKAHEKNVAEQNRARQMGVPDDIILKAAGKEPTKVVSPAELPGYAAPGWSVSSDNPYQGGDPSQATRPSKAAIEADAEKAYAKQHAGDPEQFAPDQIASGEPPASSAAPPLPRQTPFPWGPNAIDPDRIIPGGSSRSFPWDEPPGEYFPEQPDNWVNR
jgi:hypothetical protein